MFIDILPSKANLSIRGILISKATLPLHEILHPLDLGLHLLDGLSEFLRSIQVDRLGENSIVMTKVFFCLFLMEGLKIVGVADGWMGGLGTYHLIYYIIDEGKGNEGSGEL